MGCGANCACEAGRGEILEATSADGKDITAEVTGKKCSNENCKCDSEGKCTCEKGDSEHKHGTDGAEGGCAC